MLTSGGNLMSKITLSTALLVLALALSGSASAATPVYWMPAKMVAALVALSYPHQGVLSGTCAGLGKPRGQTFTGFRCIVTWQTSASGQLASGKVKVWAKPLPAGRVCGSPTGLKSCVPLARGPLPGDPRVCDYGPARVSDCVRSAAKLAIVQKIGGALANLDCVASAETVYRCTWIGGQATVMFRQGPTGWTTTVATS